MFLTGFDSKTLNTLYVDKNLKYHGLIQAFSRTNRILNEQKSQGNIVCFRNLKKNTDDAIALFSNKDAKEIILMKPYEEYVKKFNDAFSELLKITPSVNSVDELRLQGEEKQLEFVKAFRELMRVKNILDSFSDFKWSDLLMTEQQFEDYKSKYLDLYEEIKSKKGEGEKVSILEDVDFELELIHKDEINVSYILRLLALYKDATETEKKKHKDNITNVINSNPQLRSKRELIEKFIDDNLMKIEDSDAIEDEFEKFWDVEKEKAFDVLCEEEKLDCHKIKQVVDTYIYEERLPLKDDIAKTLLTKPKLLERKKIVPRVLDKVVQFVEKFYDYSGGFGSSKQNYGNSEGHINNAVDSELMVADKDDLYKG
jgi:type I restriction enzyme R subunit